MSRSTASRSRLPKGGPYGAEPDGPGQTRHEAAPPHGRPWGPLAALITPANRHDKWLAAPVLDGVVLRGPRGPRRPRHLCLDKGYAYADVDRAVRQRRIVPHIRRCGEPPLVGQVQGKPRRWVVERTNSWHNRFRGLLICWERKAANHLALVHLACGLIAWQQARF